MGMSTYTADEIISEARRQLTIAIQQLAKDTIRATGINYNAISPEYWHGPDTWEDLQRVYAEAEALSHKSAYVGMPVFGGACDQTIYLTPEANHAFRYWHDMGHVRYNMSFTPEDEATLQRRYHLDDMWRELGRPVAADQDGHVTMDHTVISDSAVALGALLAFKMYYADTIGQIEYIVARGKFPTDQLAFVLAYVDNPKMALDTDY